MTQYSKNHGRKPKKKEYVQDKYFDIKYIKNALRFSDTDPFLATDMLEKYLHEYPNDYLASGSYLSLLITTRRYDEAFIIMHKIEKDALNDYSYSEVKNGKKIEDLRNAIHFNKLRLLMHTENYKEAYSYMLDNYKQLEQIIPDIFTIEIFLKKSLGLLKCDRNYFEHYIHKQITKYSEKDFLEKMKSHMYQTNQEESGYSLFYSDFLLNKIVAKVKECIPSNDCITKGFIDEVYYFKYDSCGVCENSKTDYFSVRTFNRTKELISMYPVKDVKNLSYTDLNFMKIEEQPLSRTKKLSQIDKFNQRYGNYKK